MGRSKSAFNIDDIAREAGVSPVTVSRYFHNPELLKLSTKERLREVIERHRYVPNLYASALTTKQTMTMGLIIPTVENSIHAPLIESIQATCHEKGYSVLMGNTDYSRETELKLLKAMLQRRVSGIVHAGTLNDDSVEILKSAAKHQIPSVIVWDTIDDAEISSIGIDNFGAGYKATRYLLNRGHKEIGIIVGPYKKMNRLAERLRGYKACLRDRGSAVSDSRVISVEHRIQQGAEGLQTLLWKWPQVTGVFCASDVLAFGALYQAREQGLQVPGELSVVGFDDIEFAAYCAPPLTTVKVPGQEMGRLAVNELLDRIENDRVDSRHISLDTEIVSRRSV